MRTTAKACKPSYNAKKNASKSSEPRRRIPPSRPVHRFSALGTFPIPWSEIRAAPAFCPILLEVLLKLATLILKWQMQPHPERPNPSRIQQKAETCRQSENASLLSASGRAGWVRQRKTTISGLPACMKLMPLGHLL